VGEAVTVFGVASRYAWDVVESLWRAGLVPHCVDNHGGADPRLPGLGEPADPTPPTGPFLLGLSSGVHRAAASRAAYAVGYREAVHLVDPSAVVARTSSVAHGAYLNAGVVVASNTRVGCHANLNRSTSIGHDNVLGFAASFGPGAVTTGEVHVGVAAFVGAGATVLPGVRIGRRALVGAGAVVTRDVGDFEVVVGNPARVVRTVTPPEHEEADRCPHC
jgi:sugar O-acyltransferase (sialic acid O-acetyltransferase NeuD family)